MNFKHFTATLSLSVLAFTGLQAQDCTTFYPGKNGSEFELTSFDTKGKVDSRAVHHVNNTAVNGGTTVYQEHVTIYDGKDKKTAEFDSEITCTGDEIHFDLRNMIPAQNQGVEGMEVSMEGDDLVFPNTLHEGMTLPDASFTAKMGMNGMTLMTMTIRITNRKVVGKESVTTPAGTFTAWKITEDFDNKIMMQMKGSSVSWIAEGVGLVKTISTMENGKSAGTTELTRKSW